MAPKVFQIAKLETFVEKFSDIGGRPPVLCTYVDSSPGLVPLRLLDCIYLRSKGQVPVQEGGVRDLEGTGRDYP